MPIHLVSLALPFCYHYISCDIMGIKLYDIMGIKLYDIMGIKLHDIMGIKLLDIIGIKLYITS